MTVRTRGCWRGVSFVEIRGVGPEGRPRGVRSPNDAFGSAPLLIVRMRRFAFGEAPSAVRWAQRGQSPEGHSHEGGGGGAAAALDVDPPPQIPSRWPKCLEAPGHT